MDSEEFLNAILTCASPSGFEQEIRHITAEYLRPFADRVYTDVLGSTYAVLHENAPLRVMMTGHQDEIGFQITQIDGRGFARIRMNGGPALVNWRGSMMEVITRDGRHVPAVLVGEDTADTFIKRGGERNEVQTFFLDLGTSSKEESEQLVSVGDYVVSAPRITRIGNRLISKAMDDKIGVYVAAEAFRRLSPRLPKHIGLWFVGSSQEEVGSRGVRPAVQSINPDVAFVIDTTRTSGFPGDHPAITCEIDLGKGVGIFRNANNTEALVNRMLDVSASHGIPVQQTAHYFPVSSTDASVTQVAGKGIATALFGVPVRYEHSQAEMIDMRDVEAGIRLLTETIAAFPEDVTSFLPEI